MNDTTFGHWLAIGTGAAFLGCNIFMNTSHLWDIGAEWDQLSAVIIVTLGAAVALSLSIRAGRKKQWAFVIAFVAAWALGTAFSISASLQRTSSTVSTHVTDVRTKNMGSELAREALTDAQRDFKSAQTDMAREYEKLCDARPKECPLWSTAKNQAGAAQKRIDQARADLLKGGAKTQEDPAGSVLEAIGIISASKYALLQVMFLPLLLELGGVFIAYGFNPSRDALQVALTDLSAKEQFLTDYHADMAKGRKPNVIELAKRHGVPRSSAYKAVQAA